MKRRFTPPSQSRTKASILKGGAKGNEARRLQTVPVTLKRLTIQDMVDVVDINTGKHIVIFDEASPISESTWNKLNVAVQNPEDNQSPMENTPPTSSNNIS